ncbi:E3 ubiquitin-protein ligase At3g02290-like [Zingiber officinale]|uniref:E3 ubiquitin-protein ligase At3g02290-like n=1 Tax=Zingiber officinale TaxID=94328 RepID=UPI001C4B4687|nr:E3 ubiquitin-protein ligase At3g02290-like [Zingiber officinale]XP_042428050.1 E3 ubiquitin-protein ligase At3g02290-like [Zingiber officinale]XP_042428051.1 E3 ubiquitin-protein ligase At3g02290-like [Zingiber officinale]
MGSVCSCFLHQDMEEHPHSNALAFRNCICLRYLGQQFINVYIALFQRGVHAATSSVQERITFVSQAPTVDDSIPDTYQSPPRPIPYDDPRFSRPHHGVMSNNKFLSHYHEESESCRSNNVCETESSRMESKSKSDFDSRSKFCIPESSLKNTAEARKEVTYLFPSSEEEDVCPTCLEEYTSEDPKIIMQCSHHFHLGCIYEWMERSEACPVCGKMMVFKEAT